MKKHMSKVYIRFLILKSRFARGVFPLFAAFLVCALAAPSARAAVPADFSKTFTVTVPAGLVDAGETLTSFPLLLRLGTGIAGFDYADFQQAGADILVTDASANALPFELENWDTAGESRLWVRVPSVAAGMTLTVYYGTAETVAPPAGMWSGYAGVWHLNEVGDGATNIEDSTTNKLNGTSHASSKARSDGKLGAARGLELGGKNGAMTTVPSSAVLDALVPTFTVSGWVRPRTLAMNWGYLFARKTSDADPCWGLQFRASDNANTVGIYSNGNADNDDNRAVFATSGKFTANTWTKYAVVYDETTIRLYLDGALVASKSANPGPAVSKSNGFGIGGFPTSTNHSSLNADQDEVRLMNGAASAAWVAAEYRQESGAVALSYGAVGDMDATAPVVAAPVLSRDSATGAFTVTAELSARVPASVVCDADGVTNAMATADAALPMTYAAALSGLAANKTYACLVAATSTGGSVTEMASPTAFYTGDLSVSKVSDAYEGGLVPGAFRISRADTAHDLTVSYTVGGTAAPGQSYEALSGTATIPEGSRFVDIAVRPLLDRQTDANTTVVLTLAAGLYGIDAGAGGAELTIVNHRFARPTDFRKKMTFTPSATILSTIGESNFSDFPVLVRLPAEASASLRSANGTDLFFTDENDAELSFEVDTFDPAGETLVWVKVPSLSASTELTAYFGGAANEDNVPADVWSRYAVVVHGGDSLANAVAGGPAVSAGSSSVAANADAGRIGGGVRKSEFNAIGVNAEDVASALANTGRFSVSAWFKRVSGSGKENNGTHILAASRPDWNAGSGFVLLNEKGTYIAISSLNSHQFGSGSGTLAGDVWGHVAFSYEKGVSLTTYLNGAQDNRKTSGIGSLENTSGPWTFGSYANTASADSFKGDMDELRIFDGVASGDWIALEYATVADAAFFGAGQIENVDSAAPFVGVPVVTRAAGVFSVSAAISTNVPASVFYDADGVTGAMATADAELPMTYSAAISGLSADTTYRCSVLAVSTGGSTISETCPTAFYNGDLSVAKIADADETSLAAGVFRIYRADSAYDLAVAYTVGGTAVAGRAYAALSGTATIPAGSSFVDVAVTPILDAQTDADTTVVLTLAAGLYGIDAVAESATLTIVNHHVAEGLDFAKKMTLAPSETVLATIGQSTFADFPVLVRLPAEASAEFLTADGSDLVVTDENGTSLPFEVDTFAPAGETLVWVKVPSLSSATELTAYFGGAANVDNDPTAVWTNYAGVWHMNEPSGTVADATGNGLGASPAKATAVSVAQASGAVGTARQTATSDVKDYLSIPNYNSLGVGGNFTFSCFYDATARKGYDRLVSRKETHDAGNGWEVEMANASNKLSARGASATSISGTFSDLVSSGWMRFTFVYSGTTLTAFLNGAQIGTGTIAAATDNGKPLSIGCDSDGSEAYFVGYVDEARLRKGAASAAEVALEYATMSDATFFERGEIESVDVTAQVFETPTVVRNGNGTYTVTVVLSENSGDVGAIYDSGETAVTNVIQAAASPGTYTDTPANLTANTTYKFAAYGKNANGTEVVAKGGVFYNGELTVEKISDAAENGLVPGVFRISRADTAHDLVVAYTVGGTAIAGQTYETLSGTATILAGSNSVDIAVTPLLDAQTTSDTTVSVTLAAGFYGIDAQAGAAELTIANLVAPSGYNTWIATAPGLASVGSNWSEGHAPLATENVLFDGRFSTADCEWDADASATVASWTQAADYSGAVTFKTTFAEADATLTALTITGDAVINGGTWTLPTATSSQTSPLYRLKVSVGGSLTVASGASIDASGKAPWTTENGGAYGGSCDSTSAYGSVLEPAAPGQSFKTPGGATGENAHPAFGGGAVWLEVAGVTTLNGSILANGVIHWGWDAYCGSGGGIYLKTASLAGSGTISADGNSTGGSNGGNASAGGRISILLTGAAEMALPLANVHALGSSEYAHTGGAGTVVIRTTSLANGRLVVRNLPAYGAYKHYPPKERTTPIVAGETWTFDEIVFGANGVLRVPEGTTLSLPNGLASVSGSSDLGANRGFCGIMLDGGTLDIADTAATEHVVGNGQWMLSPNAPLTLNGSLTVQGGASVGAIRLRNESTNSFTKMELAVNGNMSVASDGYILTEGAGLTGGDANSLFAGTTYGAHGGAVGCTSETDAPADVAYDSILSPSLPGNRGSNTARYGSGVALLTVKGALTLDGTASANAIGGHWYGAAGTINITAGSLSGSGKITANGNQGGQWDADNNYHLYPGGGRVSVRLTDNGATFSEAWMANIQARGVSYMGGGSNDLRFHHSTAGTVYLQDGKQKEGAGVVRIFQNNATVNWTTVCTNDFTAFPSTRHGGESDDFRLANLEIGGGAHVFVSVDKARVGSISLAEHSTLNLNGKKFTVRSAKVNGVKLKSGTYAAGSTVAIGDGTLGDYLVDTAEGAGGELVVKGIPFAVIVR